MSAKMPVIFFIYDVYFEVAFAGVSHLWSQLFAMMSDIFVVIQIVSLTDFFFLISKVTYCVSSGMLNPADSLFVSVLPLFGIFFKILGICRLTWNLGNLPSSFGRAEIF